jgi:hypothetical protein
MSLAERLDAIRNASRTRVPETTRRVMERVVEEVRESGLVDRAVKAGDRMPAFRLPDTTGQPVSSDELLRRGPLVVSFYRGRW